MEHAEVGPEEKIRARSFAEEVVNRAGVVDEIMVGRLALALAEVRRDSFAQPGARAKIYSDMPLPARDGGEVDAPSRLARVMGLMNAAPEARVLEIGPRSGYSAALLSRLHRLVYSLSDDGETMQRVRRSLDIGGYPGVLVGYGPVQRGWAEHAPYDAVVIWPVVSEVSFDLLEQLAASSGRLVAWIGDESRAVLTYFQRKAGVLSVTRLEKIDCSHQRNPGLEPASSAEYDSAFAEGGEMAPLVRRAPLQVGSVKGIVQPRALDT